MDFNFTAALMALVTTGLVYLVIVLRLKKLNKPINLTTHNLIIAAVALAGTYYIFAGVLGLIG
jgi:hypothetical protein